MCPALRPIRIPRFATQVGDVQVGSPVSLVSGAASITLPTMAAGSHSLYASYSGDKHTAVAHVSETITVQ
jgi:Bacterial Ig-like domain (group 3)